MDSTETQPGRVLALANTIIAAYVSHHRVGRDELPAILRSVHGALSHLGKGSSAAAGSPKATPADIKRSITADRLVSFEDGKPYQTLRRHLGLRGLTAEQYRAKWGLPSDYPMTASGYSARRSELARASRLGHLSPRQEGHVATVDSNASNLIEELPAASDGQDEFDTATGITEHEYREAEGDAEITREPFDEDGAADA